MSGKGSKFAVALLLALFASAPSALDVPHNETNNINCFNCHDMYSPFAKLLRNENPHTPVNVDDTVANNLCWSCHNDVIAPYKQTHSSLTTDNGYGNWAIECRTCHDTHQQPQENAYGVESALFTGTISAATSTTITVTGAGWTTDQYAGRVVYPNAGTVVDRSLTYRILANTVDTLTIAGPMDLTKVKAGNSLWIIYGKLVRAQITTPNSGIKNVKFLRPTGSPDIPTGLPNSFSDGDATLDGVCEVCHTMTNHFRNTGLAPDQGHANVGGAAGRQCTAVCHKHEGGFAHGKGASGVGCVECHGHDAGTLFDPDATFPYTPGTQASQGRGTFIPHSTHTEFDADDKRGPQIYCSSCHDINAIPNFKSGVDLNGDGKFDLSETDVCDTCHSQGGTYNGVNSVRGSVGAKDNWHTGGVYNLLDGKLKAGKEKWCAGCHDEAPSVINAVSAPNVVGDESAETPYGIGWGFFKTGHGLASGTYPASGAPAANKGCVDCHDSTTAHIDGNARTYTAASANYQAGYRLKSVGLNQPMNIPRTGQSSGDFALCFSCHASSPFLVSTDMNTNFLNDKGTANPADDWNAHASHVMGARPANDWDSDWDGVSGDSRLSCPACHNVHGSPSPRMIRHGELISSPGTSDKVPAIDFRYTPNTTYPTLAESTGGATRFIAGGAGTVAKNGICAMCHNDSMTYTRTAKDIYPPKISYVYGVAGSNSLLVTFSEPVYSAIGAVGNLVPADFTLVDVDNGRTIVNVAHTAGDTSAAITLSAPLDSINDVGTDTLAAATTASVYDAFGNGMDTSPTTIKGDLISPSVEIVRPLNQAIDVQLNQELNFVLTDSGSGVDWTTFSIQLAGSQGYAKTYAYIDTAIVSKIGAPSAYKVIVAPDAFFKSSEVITVTVNVKDLAGNSLTPPTWSFTAASVPVWVRPQQVVDYVNFQGAGNLIDSHLATGNDFSPGGPNHLSSYKLKAGSDLYDVTGIRIYGGPAITHLWDIYTSVDGLVYTPVGAVTVGGASQWYEYAFLTQRARYVRINAWHGGAESAGAAFELQVKGTPVVYTNNAPSLSWTGETGFLTDGVNPDIALAGTTFEFRVNYSDADNNAPNAVQVWIDTNDNGTYEPTEKYAMTAVNTADTVYTDGKLYTKALALAIAGDGIFTYRFAASDGTDLATGPATAGGTVVVQ